MSRSFDDMAVWCGHLRYSHSFPRAAFNWSQQLESGLISFTTPIDRFYYCCTTLSRSLLNSNHFQSILNGTGRIDRVSGVFCTRRPSDLKPSRRSSAQGPYISGLLCCGPGIHLCKFLRTAQPFSGLPYSTSLIRTPCLSLLTATSLPEWPKAAIHASHYVPGLTIGTNSPLQKIPRVCLTYEIRPFRSTGYRN